MKLNVEQLWKDYYHYYIKFCGLEDEFKVIKHRWNFLQRFSWSLKPNPPIIKAIEEIIERLKKHFKVVGLKREQLEDKQQFLSFARKLDLNDLYGNFLAISMAYNQLSTLLGYFKNTFHQRTASLEAPYTVSGLPQSPERTVGIELMLLAADRLVERYLECVEISEWQWDGVISFAYPELGPFGGSIALIPFARTFHISLSEDGKYFIGDYFALAHEVGHMVVAGPPVTHNPPFPEEREWVIDALNKINPCIRDMLSRLLQRLADARKKYKNEYYERVLSFSEKIAKYICHDCLRTLFCESLADLIGFKIAGIFSLHHLIDYVLNIETFLRTVVVHGFNQSDELSSDVDEAKKKMLNKIGIKNIHEYGEPIEILNFALDCVKKVGEKFAEFDSKRKILSSIIREEFQISSEEEKEIKDYLLKRQSCASFDPRKIMHVYYKLYREEGNPPDYAVTLHSLAFNRYKKEKGDKKGVITS